LLEKTRSLILSGTSGPQVGPPGLIA
jgi:hypothetical protein